MTLIIDYSLPIGDRISMRKNLIQTFLCENPGTGNGNNASRYRYNVYPSIAQNLQQIYHCIPISLVPTGATFRDYAGNKHPIEIILLAVKWLFMEQDCAYWNYSGRAMFYDVLQENELI